MRAGLIARDHRLGWFLTLALGCAVLVVAFGAVPLPRMDDSMLSALPLSLVLASPIVLSPVIAYSATGQFAHLRNRALRPLVATRAAVAFVLVVGTCVAVLPGAWAMPVHSAAPPGLAQAVVENALLLAGWTLIAAAVLGSGRGRSSSRRRSRR